jgi:hypothetical protein
MLVKDMFYKKKQSVCNLENQDVNQESPDLTLVVGTIASNTQSNENPKAVVETGKL